jgi:hypothetical protein
VVKSLEVYLMDAEFDSQPDVFHAFPLSLQANVKIILQPGHNQQHLSNCNSSFIRPSHNEHHTIKTQSAGLKANATGKQAFTFLPKTHPQLKKKRRRKKTTPATTNKQKQQQCLLYHAHILFAYFTYLYL